MPYFDTPEKKQNRESYKNTVELCKTDEDLISAITSSVETQRVILETEELLIPKSTSQKEAEIVVTNKRSIKAAMDHKDDKVCVLNFASFTKPGGGVAYGCRAQEEGICRVTSLMQCISDKKCIKEFYEPHKQLKYPLHNDDLIYTKDVVVIKKDDLNEELLPKSEWKRIDIITCAAPSFSEKPTNRYNPDDGDKPIHLSAEELTDLLVKRITRIFEAAYINGAEILILGAYGCGAFKNPPRVVSGAFKKVIETHRNWFKTIEFAVPSFGDNPNYRIFYNTFMSKKPVEVEENPVEIDVPNIIGHKLTHKTFGEGVITKQDGTYLSVEFEEETKNLKLEYVFTGNAHLDDEEIDSKLYELAKAIRG